jgi:DAK2 domain fusion protein YloV
LVDNSPLTGKKLKILMQAAARYLEINKEAANALNVFPVPDGDTGTNMCLTVAAALREMEKVASPSLGETVKALALGSLMGARGNSGVILSQLFRGIGKSLQEHRVATPLQVAWAMQEGVDTAYKAVMKPVEGTILTVAREMSRSALQAAKKGLDLEQVLSVAVLRGRDVLAKTPDMLPVLKQAGVVDAGGMGFLCLFEGGLRGLRGEEITATAIRDAGVAGLPVTAIGDHPAPAAATGESGGDIHFTYDLQMLIRGARLAVDKIRAQLEPLGDSLLVVGDPHLVKVHVHTNEPHQALAICLSHGEIIEASVENMREQLEAVQRTRMASAAPDGTVVPMREARTAGPAAAGWGHPLVNLPAAPATSSNGLGVVVVASGDGLEEIFRNLGADVVVSGGQTMNPSTEDILRALESIPARDIFVLPNNGNILMAAKQTVELTDKAVRVIPSKSIPQGIAALVALNRSLDAERNQSKMEQVLTRVRSGEITQAVRSSKYKDIEICGGDFIGLLDDELVTVGRDCLRVLSDLVGRMANAETEIVTLFYGNTVSAAEAALAGDELRKKAPGHEVEVHRGGQPLYHYLVSVE